MRNLEYDFFKKTPEQINKLLHNKYELSIYKFAQLLASTVACGDTIGGRTRYAPQDIKVLRQRLANLDKNIFNIIANFEHFITGKGIRDFPKKDLSKPDLKRNLINYYGLDEFYDNFISKQKAFLDEVEQQNIKRNIRSGTPITRKSQIAATWGSLIENKMHPFDWSFIENLYLWFWDRLQDYPFYAELEPPQDNLSNYLKIQFHRHKKNNFVKESNNYHGANDGITLLLENYSWSDPDFRLLSDYLSQRLLSTRRSYIEDTGFDAFEVAIKLFKINIKPAPAENLRSALFPLIVFPDLSYYHPGR